MLGLSPAGAILHILMDTGYLGWIEKKQRGAAARREAKAQAAEQMEAQAQMEAQGQGEGQGEEEGGGRAGGEPGSNEEAEGADDGGDDGGDDGDDGGDDAQGEEEEGCSSDSDSDDAGDAASSAAALAEACAADEAGSLGGLGSGAAQRIMRAVPHVASLVPMAKRYMGQEGGWVAPQLNGGAAVHQGEGGALGEGAAEAAAVPSLLHLCACAVRQVRGRCCLRGCAQACCARPGWRAAPLPAHRYAAPLRLR